MSLDPIFAATPIMQIHIVSAILAIALGPITIWRRRHDRLHKIVGYTWVISMALVAISSFGIFGAMEIIGPFSPLHGLSIWVLYSLWTSIQAARRGDIATHRGVMRGLYLGGIWVAFAFNFLPGRTVNRLIFPDTPEAGWVAIAAILFVAISLWGGFDKRIQRRFA